MFCMAMCNRWLEDAAYWHADCIVDGEFLAADIKRVESVGAVF